MRTLRFFATSSAEEAPASATVVYVPSSDASWAFADVDVAREFARSVGAHGIGRIKGSRAKERGHPFAGLGEAAMQFGRAHFAAIQRLPQCPRCGAGPLGNCGYYGCEIPRNICPLKNEGSHG